MVGRMFDKKYYRMEEHEEFQVWETLNGKEYLDETFKTLEDAQEYMRADLWEYPAILKIKIVYVEEEVVSLPSGERD